MTLSKPCWLSLCVGLLLWILYHCCSFAPMPTTSVKCCSLKCSSSVRLSEVPKQIKFDKNVIRICAYKNYCNKRLEKTTKTQVTHFYKAECMSSNVTTYQVCRMGRLTIEAPQTWAVTVVQQGVCLCIQSWPATNCKGFDMVVNNLGCSSILIILKMVAMLRTTQTTLKKNNGWEF